MKKMSDALRMEIEIAKRNGFRITKSICIGDCNAEDDPKKFIKTPHKIKGHALACVVCGYKFELVALLDSRKEA